MTTAAILLAGGSGSRVQRELNKVYLPIRDRPVLAYSLETFERSRMIDRIVVVVREEDGSLAGDLVETMNISTPITVVVGGPTRHRSEMEGLEALASAIESGEVELVAIHDGARPFMTLELLERVVQTAVEVGGAIPGLAVESPLYRVVEDSMEPLPSESLRRVQTPQVFWARPLLEAYRRSIEAGVEGVDTAETVERFSDVEVEVVEGDARNLKVTFVEDFFQAEEWAAAWKDGCWVS